MLELEEPEKLGIVFEVAKNKLAKKPQYARSGAPRENLEFGGEFMSNKKDEKVIAQMRAEELTRMVTFTDGGKYTRAKFHHLVESDLIFESLTEGSILRELTPVAIRACDVGVKIPVDTGASVLVGKTFEQEEKMAFRVIPLKELRSLIDGEFAAESEWKYTKLKDLSILVRTSWTATLPLNASHRTEREREAFTNRMKKQGAKFVQMSVNTGSYSTAVWGIDHVVYPLEVAVEPTFLPLYLERKYNVQKEYDFAHRCGYLYRLPTKAAWA